MGGGWAEIQAVLPTEKLWIMGFGMHLFERARFHSNIPFADRVAAKA